MSIPKLASINLLFEISYSSLISISGYVINKNKALGHILQIDDPEPKEGSFERLGTTIVDRGGGGGGCAHPKNFCFVSRRFNGDRPRATSKLLSAHNVIIITKADKSDWSRAAHKNQKSYPLMMPPGSKIQIDKALNYLP